MQMLGAFAFLSQVKGRPGFEEHIPQALGRLRSLLDEPELEESPVLRKYVDSLELEKE
jgi:aminoglycoside/choline kinase family phosphotransferase